MTIVYLHGFRSSPASAKAAMFKSAIAAMPRPFRPRLLVPDLQFHPADAVAQVAALVRREGDGSPLGFVGSSLGGFYATWLAEHFGARAVLINPAVRPYAVLEPYLGAQTNLYTGAQFEVTQAHFDELKALAVERITRPDRYFLLVETGDEVLDYREAVAHYAGAWQYVRGGGDHAFSVFAEQIPAIMRFAGVAWS